MRRSVTRALLSHALARSGLSDVGADNAADVGHLFVKAAHVANSVLALQDGGYRLGAACLPPPTPRSYSPCMLRGLQWSTRAATASRRCAGSMSTSSAGASSSGRLADGVLPPAPPVCARAPVRRRECIWLLCGCSVGGGLGGSVVLTRSRGAAAGTRPTSAGRAGRLPRTQR